MDSNPGIEIVGLVCSNQATVSWLLGALIAHTGFSVLSATLKKMGFSQGVLVQIIRLLAVDLKPPASVIVAQAQQIQAQQPKLSMPDGSIIVTWWLRAGSPGLAPGPHLTPKPERKDMAINFSSIFAAIIAEGPSLFADIEAEFEAIAHGEGGVQKVANAAQGLAVIASAVAKGAVAVAGKPTPGG